MQIVPLFDRINRATNLVWPKYPDEPMYIVRYSHQERNHQGLEDKLVRPEFRPLPKEGAIKCRKRLSGMLRYYHREAA
jgi:hypothetical protein